jgi:hypothetical protein
MRSVVGLLVLATLFASAARAELAPGDRAPPVLAIAGKQVPLPEGNWIVAGRAPGAVTPGKDLGSYGTIWNVVLLRISPRGALDAMAEINVNDMAVDDGWGVAADCQRSDLVLTVVRSRAGWDAACFFVTHTIWNRDTALPAAWRQANAVAAQRGLILPATTVTAGFRVANRRDIIDVRFHFLADPADVPATNWNASQWSRDQLQQDRWRLAFDRSVAEWSAMMIGHVEAGLKNRLPPTWITPTPGAAEASLDYASIMSLRQRRLAALRSSGLLSAAQADRQSALLRQAEADDSHDAIDPGADDFYRLLSYQGLSVTSDALVTFMWTAQSVQAAAVTLLQASLRTGRSYAVAYLWDWYGDTPTRPDIARTVDFAYGGVDR